MGRIKQSRVNSTRMRTARRAFGTADLPPPFYPHGTPQWQGQDKRLEKAEATERRRLAAEGRQVMSDPKRREEVFGALRDVDAEIGRRGASSGPSAPGRQEAVPEVNGAIEGASGHVGTGRPESEPS